MRALQVKVLETGQKKTKNKRLFFLIWRSVFGQTFIFIIFIFITGV